MDYSNIIFKVFSNFDEKLFFCDFAEMHTLNPDKLLNKIKERYGKNDKIIDIYLNIIVRINNLVKVKQ